MRVFVRNPWFLPGFGSQDHAGITRLAGPGLWKPGAVKDQTPLQILTIRQMLQRVAFIMPTV
ncbi:hypothetical protein EOS_03120 [Caballeronia mineralivorans PML1(12)]|uniref:Uncharacterized protein n=1 Tax=Caballeronia mineralivorans PML1(12) TaxID=908627 RepID=A0A0J1D4J6_9BURK|nr:hypothetical protein EOS_03120 [Caballeronia mineralivorans PML1(12)]